MQFVWRALFSIGLLGAAAASAFGLAGAVLPAEGAVARGVRLGGLEIHASASAETIAEEHARVVLDRRFLLRHGGGPVAETSLAELGATIDTAVLAKRLASIAHEDDLWTRLDQALEARRGHIDLFVPISLPADELAARLARRKEELDTGPRNAKLDVSTHIATGETPGRYIDVYATLAEIDRVLATPPADGAAPIDLPEFVVAARGSKEVVAALDTSAVVATFTTRFGAVGGQADRAKNIARAASQIEGVVLLPGEVVSFNDNVGPRSRENGFFPAPEIYKGEMREGIGGGTCQVSGTLHAAAFLGGLDVVERSNHSRPSGYIGIGLDATVVYPVVDLKLRNPYRFPIVIHSTLDKGTLTFQLLGRDRPATVEFGTDTVGVAAYKRKVEEAPWLPAGKVVKKQKGIRGLSIRKTRRIHLPDGEERVEVTTDVYPPTLEIYLVPPGTDLEEALPPLPEAATG